MKYTEGHNRNQIFLFPVSLDESMDPDNEVRFIDLGIVNILAYDRLRDYLRALLSHFTAVFDLQRRIINRFEELFPRLIIFSGKNKDFACFAYF